MSVVYELGKANGKFLFFVRRVLVEAKRFQIAVRRVQNFPARRFVYATALHTNQTVFHDIQKPDTVLPAHFVERENDFFRAHFLIVERNGFTLFEINRDIGGFVGRLQRRYAHFQEPFFFVKRFVARVFQIQALVAQMPQILVLGIVRFTANFQGYVVRFRVLDFLFARFDRPFSPRRDNGHIGRKRFDRKLETHLIVPLTRTAVANSVRTFFFRDLHDTLRDYGTGKRSTQQIFLVFCARLHGGDYVFVYEFVRQVLYVQLGRARLQSLFFQALQLVRLSYVSAHRDNFAVIVIFLQPRNDDRSVQTARIGKYYFFDVFLIHNKFLLYFCINILFIQRLCNNYTPCHRVCQTLLPFIFNVFPYILRIYCINV